jgi:RNA polymerase sigma-70 factor (ECF subfamily)
MLFCRPHLLAWGVTSNERTLERMSTALTTAYRLYFPLLVQKCKRMLGDGHEAEDVAQETFMRLHHAGLANADPRVVTSWLYRTSTRMAIDRLRARKRRAPDAAAVDSLSVPANSENHAIAREIWHAIAEQLPDLELEAALLTRVDGLTQDEVAEVLGTNPRRVRRLLTRFEACAEAMRRREGLHT